MPFETQFKMIKKGKEKFIKEGIKIRSFFAPNYTYDLNTILALKKKIKLRILLMVMVLHHIKNMD